MLTLRNSNLPPCLSTLAVPPDKLFVLGDLPTLLGRPALAVVGSRRASVYGRRVTHQLVSQLASVGVVIVSGLALGIDAVAHQAALQVGGKTIAVLPSGLDRIYPSSHYHLAQDIIKNGGAIVSEYPAGTAPLKHQFIARNRLVAGLANAVLVTEAAANSGTLYTANFALEQGKPVLAIPGNLDSPGSVGTNNLLKSGAMMVTDMRDLLDALGLATAVNGQEIIAANPEEQAIIDQLKQGVSDAHEMMVASHLSAPVFNQTLTMMELSGKIRPLGANNWAIK